MPIPELSREKLRILRSLSSAKMRKKKGLCLVEGERALAEAFRSKQLLYLVTEEKGTDQEGEKQSAEGKGRRVFDKADE